MRNGPRTRLWLKLFHLFSLVVAKNRKVTNVWVVEEDQGHRNLCFCKRFQDWEL